MSNSKSKRGRPTVMTPKKLALLEHAFDIGATDEEACNSAQISTSTLYNYQSENPYFLEEKEARKIRPILIAKETIVNAIPTNLNIAKWYLERKKRDEFSTHSTIQKQKENKQRKKIKDDPRVLKTIMKASISFLQNMGFVITHPDTEINKMFG